MRSAALAIEMRDVAKRYRLYPNRLALALDLSGIAGWFGLNRGYPERHALAGVSLEVPRGTRLGVIGRNGAGKTTMLKLLTGNFLPDSGSISVMGRVQALMTAGLGFHPELTGAQNIRASLVYNGLDALEFEEAFADVIEFAELGEYLDQPLKTYSLGMQSRLAFATATAVKPDILIVDEVLGAGDAYFATKSAERMVELTSNGLTLVLVSHSMAQVLQFCERSVWLEQGSIAMEGKTLEVIKAYERFIRTLDEDRLNRRNAGALLQKPRPEAGPAVSVWPGIEGPKISAFRTLGRDGKPRVVFESGERLEYEISINGAATPASCIVAVNTYLLDGKQVMLDWSPRFNVPSEGGTVRLRYDPLVLGNGEYVVSVGLYKTLDMLDTSTAEYFDLWDRSFQFRVVTAYSLDQSLCKAPAAWRLPGELDDA